MRCGRVFGKRDRQDAWVQPFLGGFDPRLEAMAFPGRRLHQHDLSRLHEQDAQIAIALLRYLAEDRAISSRHLPGHQPEPCAEVAPFENGRAIADRGRQTRSSRDSSERVFLNLFVVAAANFCRG